MKKLTPNGKTKDKKSNKKGSLSNNLSPCIKDKSSVCKYAV